MLPLNYSLPPSHSENLVEDLNSCQPEGTGRQASVAIVQIRFYVFWCVFFQSQVVEIRITIIIVTFQVSPPTTSAPVSTSMVSAINPILRALTKNIFTGGYF